VQRFAKINFPGDWQFGPILVNLLLASSADEDA
jgi:hypothetical protein